MHHDPMGAPGGSGRWPSGRGRCTVLTISSGHSASYLTDAVAAGRENYYSGAVAAGEPPGRWYGAGAERLGLSGFVDTQDMTALYEHYIDPRDSGFRDPAAWPDAQRLGHSGRRYPSADAIHAALIAAEPHASPERHEELRVEAAKKARSNVAFYDATFSVQKSVTVLHTAFEAQEIAAQRAGDDAAAAAWAQHRQAVEDAIWAGNRAGLDYLAEHAGYSRLGHHGGAAGRWVDAHAFTVASFFQHDNRDHDPQLHVHNAILNRVQGPDGQWRTLDGRGLYAHRGAAAAVAERTMEEHLTVSLGISFATRPDGRAREVTGIAPEVLDLFSTRRRAITAKTAELVDAYEARFGRAPNALELDRLQRQATFATRRAKTHDGETVQARLDRWDRELRVEVAGGLAQVARDVLALGDQPRESPQWSPDAVLETALADVQATKAAWTRADLTRAISDALPDHLGGLDATHIAALLDGLTERALKTRSIPLTADDPAAATLPASLRLDDGTSAYQRPGSQLFATDEHVRAERVLRASAVARGAPAVTMDAANAFLTSLSERGVELGVDQAAAVRGALTSGARVEVLVGPAGTGKSFVVGAIAEAWRDPTTWGGQPRRVVGLASSQIASEVLAGEGLDARNVTRWLATQQRLTVGRGGAEDEPWRLHAGDLIVLDESAMTSTADLTAVHAHADAAGAKLLLTGDHRQLAAVGAGGGMGLIAEHAVTHELAEVRRFSEPWERAASLRLREGDTAALTEYRTHGRIVDGGTVEHAEARAARAWLADTLAGRHSVLIADTNEQADRVSARLRADLVRLGRVAEHGVPLPRQGTVAGVGDLIQARRNGWDLAGHEGNRRGPINRERYRVVETRPDGSLVVTPEHGNPVALAGSADSADTAAAPTGDRPAPEEPIVLPAGYVAEHVTLGYASTVHAAQGLTVDTCHTIATARTGQSGLYVGLSRGRHANTAYVATITVPDDAPPGAAAKAQRRDPLSVLIGAAETAQPDLAALAVAETSHAEATSMRTLGERFADVAEQVTAAHTSAALDRLVDDGALTSRQRAALAADDGMSTLARVLRQAEVAGHDPDHVLDAAVRSRPLDGSRSLASVLHQRILDTTSLDPSADRYADWTPSVTDPAWRQHLADLAHAADERRHELGDLTRDEQPRWAVQALGPLPDDPVQRHEWARRAGLVAAHRELVGHDDEATPIPGPPKPGQVEAYASWRAAWRALGRPEADRAEAEMSDGQLRVRVRAYEREKAWEPDYVAHELAATTQAEVRARQDAELLNAEAEAADPAHRDRLLAEASAARGRADELAAQRDQLTEADQIRARWYAHTAATRAAADRARAELGARGIDPDRPEDATTAEEWLGAHAAANKDQDRNRAVTDGSDLADVAAARRADVTAETDMAEIGAEQPQPDIRQVAATERARETSAARDWTRVPNLDETAAAVARARRALVELEQRDAEDAYREREERVASLSRRHADDRSAGRTREAEASMTFDATAGIG